MAIEDDRIVLLDAQRRYTIFEEQNSTSHTEKDQTPFGRWNKIDENGVIIESDPFNQSDNSRRPTWVQSYPYVEPTPPEPPPPLPPDLNRGSTAIFDAMDMRTLFVDINGTAPVYDTKAPLGLWNSTIRGIGGDPTSTLTAPTMAQRPTWVYDWPYNPPAPPEPVPEPTGQTMNDMRDQFNCTFPMLDIDTSIDFIFRRGTVNRLSTGMSNIWDSSHLRGYTLIEESSDDGWISPNWTRGGSSVYAQLVQSLSMASNRVSGERWYFQINIREVEGRGVPTVRILLRNELVYPTTNTYPIIELSPDASVTWMDLGFDPIEMAKGLDHTGYSPPSNKLSRLINMRPLTEGYPSGEEGKWFYLDTTLPLWGVLNFTHQGWDMDEIIDNNRSFVPMPLAPMSPIISMWGDTKNLSINYSLVPITEITMEKAYSLISCTPNLGQYGGFSSGGNLERMLPFLIKSSSGYADYYLNHSIIPPDNVYRQVVANYGTNFIKKSEVDPFTTNRRGLLVYTGSESTNVLYSPIARAGSLGDVTLDFENHTVITNYIASDHPNDYTPFYSFDS